MKYLPNILLLWLCIWAAWAGAQTPYDSFAPEMSRPILDKDSVDAWRKEQQMLREKEQTQREQEILTRLQQEPLFVAFDMPQQMCYLLDTAMQVLAYTPIPEDVQRWLSVDPLVDQYIHQSPYVYANNNPTGFIDPNGMWVEVAMNEEGTYTIQDGIANDDRNIYLTQDGKRTGEILGQMLTNYSFFDENNNVVSEAVIDMQDLSGEKFLADFIEKTPSLFLYVFGNKSQSGRYRGRYDFKIKGFPYDSNKEYSDISIYRGMPLVVDGQNVIGSARDIGNYAAGYLAGVNGIPYFITRIAFDVYNKHPEPPVSQGAQILGHNRGYLQYLILTTPVNAYSLCR